MDNSQTLELQIKSKAQEAKASVESLVKSLTNVENVLTNIYLEMGSIEKKTDSSINKSATATKNINQLKQSTDKATSSADKLGNAFKKVFTFAGVKRLTTTALGWMNEAIDYTEQLNLFNVVFDNTEKNGKQMFSELGKSATQFQYKMNEAFGTNKTQTLYMQGIFESMGETVGIEDKYSSIMSETMTKLTYDLASLYNKTEKTTAEAIRAGVYAAQTKPLRSYGIDVTMSSLQPIAESLGITESVKNMSQAEKEILRYIATLKQAKIAMGDLANTVESPSNQLKILRQQLVEAKVALSSLFIGTFSKILPYANAILMVIKEVSKAIADMFGIELKDYNSGIASQEGIYDGIADSADDASSAVKELKRQTLGFDEIHNINENKDSDSNSGGTSGGIDQRLLDAIQGYDNGMDKVRMKATEIRDKMMEWLGFTKKINPLTGEVSFKLTNTNTSMGKIIEYLKDIVKYGKEAITGVFKVIKDDFDNGAFGKILVGVFKSIKDLLGFIAKHKSAQKIIGKLVEAFLLFKTVKTILSPVVTLYKNLINKVTTGAGTIEKFVKQLKGQNNYIIDTNGELKQYNKTIEGHNNVILNADGSINKWKTALNKAKTALDGVLISAVGIYTLNESIKDASENGWDFSNSLVAVVGGLSTIGGMAMAGSTFGPIGTAIGILIGSFSTLRTAIFDYQTDFEKQLDAEQEAVEEHLRLADEVKAKREELDQQLKDQLSDNKIYEDLYNELLNYVDANGKVQESDEKRVEFILGQLSSAYGVEYQLIDGKITKWEELKGKINETIKMEQAEIIMSNSQQSWYEALTNKNSYLEELKKSIDHVKNSTEKVSEAEARYNDNLLLAANGSVISRAELEKSKEALEKTRETLNNANDDQKKWATEYINSMINVGNYEDLWAANSTGNYELVSQIASRTSDESYNAWIEKITKLTKEIDPNAGEIGKDLVDQWGALGMSNEKKFMSEFSKLNTDIQQQLINKMNENGYKISSELSDGLKKNNPKIDVPVNIIKPTDTTIKIDADVSKAQQKTDTWWSKFKKNVGGFLGGLLLKENGGVYSNGSWKNISQYANGGAPNHGSMFVAGEHGAEIVGNINGKTEVLNQSQIASAIYGATLNAMTQVMSQYNSSNEINVHVHTDEGTVVDRINQKTKQTGVCPINIPVC